MHIVHTSYGNDSVALLQWCLEKGLEEVHALHCSTGWSAPWWEERIARCQDWAQSCGIETHYIASEGMESLVRRKKAWPFNGAQFCTKELKVEPANKWMAEVDPDGDAICLVGVRRAESRHRQSWPEWTYDSGGHGGRDLWAPLVNHSNEERDALLDRAGFEALPHRSMECFPCINSNRGDFLELTEGRIAEIEALEESMGITSNGKPRTMFRPHRHQGAVGIREVVKWARFGDYDKDQPMLFGGGCDSVWCEV